MVAKPTGEDAKPVDAEGTGLTLESAFIRAPVEGNEAAIEAAMPGQLAQGYQPSAQGAAGGSLNDGANLGGQSENQGGQGEDQGRGVVTPSDPLLAGAAEDNDTPGILVIVGLGVVAAAAAASGSKATQAVASTVTDVASTVTDVDTQAPVFSSGATANFAENGTGTAYDATADSDSGVTYTKSGTDAGLFNINASTGLVTFATSPDFEVPADAGANNVYNLNVIATDAAGNATTKEVAITVTDVVEVASVIDLGVYGKLIRPVQVEGNWYYYWDRSGDGTSANTGALNGGLDRVNHDVLDGIFKATLAEVNDGAVGSGTNTTDAIRYATLNNVKVALPTANGGAAYPQGLDRNQNGTSYSDAGASTNGTTSIFNELLAIWDAYKGTGTGTGASGTPTGWQSDEYWSATLWSETFSTEGHVTVGLSDGKPRDSDDALGAAARYVALQVL